MGATIKEGVWIPRESYRLEKPFNMGDFKEFARRLRSLSIRFWDGWCSPGYKNFSFRYSFFMLAVELNAKTV